jgi:predicted branched-subunit amino acid permease
MKASTKAVLLSALVFPGAGQFYLKRPLIASVLLMSTLAAVYVLASRAISMAQNVLEKINSGEVQPDLLALTDMISTSNTPTTHWATIALVVIWLVGVVDAHVHSRRRFG